MLNSVDLRANIAVMKILVKLLIQDYLHIPCKKQLMKYTAGMLRPISKNIFNHHQMMFIMIYT